MSQFGYGSGGYLTRFEDFYKSSSDDSEDEDESKSKIQKIPPPVPSSSFKNLASLEDNKEDVFKQEAHYYSESDDDEDNEGEIRDPLVSDEGALPSKDWVPLSNDDLKMTIKPPKNFKGYQEGAYPENVEELKEEEDNEDKTFSNDYADVCKFKCNLCGLDIDSEKLRSHINNNHDNTEGVDNELDSNRPYSIKNYHKCGLCNKTLLFTRVRLRYHIINEHNMAIQDYNEQFMAKRGAVKRFRRGSGDTAEGGENDVDPSTVDEADISNDYADIMKILCKICNKHVEKDNFRFIHLKKHGMDVADYKVSYGDPVPVKNSYHRCHICQTIFSFTRSRLAGHLARHKISVRDYGKKYLTKVKVDRNFTSNLAVGEIDTNCMFSNDYEDECQTICKICDRSLNYGNLGSHLYQSHSTRMKDYVEQYGEPDITKKSYHECAICHETLLFIRYHLLTHVKTKHNMTISAYNKAHMQLHNVEYGDSNIMDKGRKIGTQKAPQWCDGTMYKCPYCFNIYYRYFTFRIHLINSHKMTDTEERSICVRENEILTDIYRCKICSTQVKRDRMDIEAHLKQAHKTTLKIYSANFENPSNQETHEATVSKLVRMGVLEEPSKNMCKTPKKIKPKQLEIKSDISNEVPDNENLNKFVSVSENVPEESQVVIKSEIEESQNSQEYSFGSLISGGGGDENDLSLSRKRKRKLPSKFNSDFEISKPGSSKSEGDKKPILTQKNTNSIKSDPSGPSSSAGDDGGVRYKCPISGCSWTCGKDGMRQGPAVLHLLKIHKIQPLQMRERGIKFDKIQG